MLDPATRKWRDLSTDKKFQFPFFCDCCHKYHGIQLWDGE